MPMESSNQSPRRSPRRPARPGPAGAAGAVRRSLAVALVAGTALLPWTGMRAAVAPPADAGSHWAFQPVRMPSVPDAGRQSDRVRSPVDCFILSRQDAAGLRLAPAADRRVLARRASYDLTGLPPAPAEVDAFVADPRPDAFERLVERLMESPHYGERWGRWWLDLARYADTNGQDENKVMANAWRYRDWVVRAFNSGMPFDRFVTEQLAGDLLPTNGVPESVIFDRWTATGFLVLGPKMLAEQDKPKLVMDLVDEQIDTVGRAMLGLTVSCSRCHDHKFDPVPMRDYYALAGIFKSTRAMQNLDFVSKFNERPVATKEHLAAIEAHHAALKAKTAAIEGRIREAGNVRVAERIRTFAEVHRAATVPGAPTNGLEAGAIAAVRKFLETSPASLGAGELLAGWVAKPAELAGRLREIETFTTSLRVGPGRTGAGYVCDGQGFLEMPHRADLEPAKFTLETWVRVEEFPKDGDKRRWLVAKNANEWVDGHVALILDDRVPGAYLNVSGGRGGEILVRAPDRAIKAGEWHHFAMTFDEASLRLYVDGQAAGEQAVGRARVHGTGPLVIGKRPDGYSFFKGQLDEVRLSNRALSAAELAERVKAPDAAPVDGLVARWDFDVLKPEERAAASRWLLRDFLYGPGGFLTVPKDAREGFPAAVREEIAAMEKERDALKESGPEPAPQVLAVAEDKPVELPLHIRGSHLNLAKEPIPRGFIRVASHGASNPIPPDRSGRLELAQWLTSPDHPLTARVTVNRIWQAHFGEGLVRTPDNFGLRGEKPTHPELLDWLAGELIRSGWDLRHLHRLILHSAVWQARSSTVEDDGLRQGATDPDNRLLAFFPRQRLEAEMVRDAVLAVAGRLDRTTGGTLVKWKNDDYTPGDEVSGKSLRRSIYLPIVRDRVFDVFTIFDCANPSVGTSKRTPTVVSHQALFFLNSPMVKESARAMAKAVLADGTFANEQQRAVEIYRRILQRPATSAEIDRAQRFVTTAGGVAAGGSQELAWTALCQAVLASNEFLYRD